MTNSAALSAIATEAPTIRLLDAPFGATVEAFDGARPLPATTVLALKEALRDHHILIFKNQRLTDDAYLRFSAYFGSVYRPPADAPVLGSDASGRAPDIVLVANVDNCLLGADELAAHVDHHWTLQPSASSFFYALETPSAGGETIFYDLVGAYDALDEKTKTEIDDLQLITYNPFLRRKHPLPGGRPLYRTPNIQRLEPYLAHPLVRTHPESGRKLIFLGAGTEVEIVDYDPEAGAALIARLRQHVAEPRFRYKHTWTVGDIVWWDNQATLHGRDAFDNGERRVMKRISLAGSRPF
jgi:alpha-ketoglutarate-dependent taurine dioxygenase